ncbi:C-type lectin domain family 4 member M-like [Pempheris klunzingeri]|uniref:C-type lectin domain family 4 member M-like n=1 Tax=Pempheris klunzingeri TaxID=3127111 RepID=UPI003980358F
MEEELNYVAVAFRADSIPAHEKLNDLEIIYDEVMTEKQQAWNTNPVITGNEKRAPLFTLLHLVAACLGVICISLVSAIIALSIRFNTVLSEQHRENINLTTQNQQLWTEKTDLERRTEELTRERDGLNWTVGVILEYDNFPVNKHCPQRVCKPCLDGWVLFQSNCYLFLNFNYYNDWRIWQQSRDRCREMHADLVVIESQEEQEFINNHTTDYSDVKHGYWIGLRVEDVTDRWMWVDGSNVTVMYWTTQRGGHKASCALTLPHAEPLANWQKTSCEMRNRWICETRALIKPDEPNRFFNI